MASAGFFARRAGTLRCDKLQRGLIAGRELQIGKRVFPAVPISDCGAFPGHDGRTGLRL